MTERSAIVIGGGIGGLATAAGLLRTGWRVTVLEQAPRLAAVGAGITLEPNAVRALDWLGAGSALRQHGAASGAAGLRTAAGRWLVRTTIDQLTARQGLPAYALHRSDLHRVLLSSIAGADLRTGHLVTGIATDADQAEVSYLGDGGATGTARADLIVGADGVRSTARQAVFPNHPKPSYAGYLTWRGVTPTPTDLTLPGVTESWGRGLRFGVVPLADRRVYWFAAIAGPEGANRQESLDDIAARFAIWHAPIPALLAATPADALLAHDIFHMATPLPSYVNGRVALVGDSVHAMTPDLGQGAGQALEDAVTLAASVADATDIGAALRCYDLARRPRSQKLVRASARVARLANVHDVAFARLRDLAAWMLPNAAFLRATDDIFGWRPPPALCMASP
jgi:2-polyprenyl-6-methoxyphenol hydroxylase-like FAD-dependent oxidoreductase